MVVGSDGERWGAMGAVGLPFGYKAAKEQQDTESYEVVVRKTKGVGGGVDVGEGFCLPR